MSTWRGNRQRSHSRPRAGGRMPGVEYVSPASAPRQFREESDYPSDSSDSSEGSYESRPPSIKAGSRPPSIHIPSNGGSGVHRRAPPSILRMPRAPAAPESPNTPSLRSGSSDSPSSHASSGRYHDYVAPSPQMEPEIAGSDYSRGGEYSRGYYQEKYSIPPPPPPQQQPKPRPNLRRPPPPDVPIPAIPNCIVAEPDEHELASPISPSSPNSCRGGPKAFSYLAANAPLSTPEAAGCDSPGPTQVNARMAFPATHIPPQPQYQQQYQQPYQQPYQQQYVPQQQYMPQQQFMPQQQYMQQYRHYPQSSASRSDWGEVEDYSEEESVYSRRSRPRGGVRHVPAGRDRPRSRSRGPRDRSRPRNHYDVIEVDMRSERSHRSQRPRSISRPRSRSRSRPPPGASDKRRAELQAQIDALTNRLNNVMDDPYAQQVMAEDGIKFEKLILK